MPECGSLGVLPFASAAPYRVSSSPLISPSTHPEKSMLAPRRLGGRPGDAAGGVHTAPRDGAAGKLSARGLGSVLALALRTTGEMTSYPPHCTSYFPHFTSHSLGLTPYSPDFVLFSILYYPTFCFIPHILSYFQHFMSYSRFPSYSHFPFYSPHFLSYSHISCLTPHISHSNPHIFHLILHVPHPIPHILSYSPHFLPYSHFLSYFPHPFPLICMPFHPHHPFPHPIPRCPCFSGQGTGCFHPKQGSTLALSPSPLPAQPQTSGWLFPASTC